MKLRITPAQLDVLAALSDGVGVTPDGRLYIPDLVGHLGVSRSRVEDRIDALRRKRALRADFLPNHPLPPIDARKGHRDAPGRSRGMQLPPSKVSATIEAIRKCNKARLRVTSRVLADRLGVGPTAVHLRLRRLESECLIRRDSLFGWVPT
jgi:hypothetical protein